MSFLLGNKFFYTSEVTFLSGRGPKNFRARNIFPTWPDLRKIPSAVSVNKRLPVPPVVYKKLAPCTDSYNVAFLPPGNNLFNNKSNKKEGKRES